MRVACRIVPVSGTLRDCVLFVSETVSSFVVGACVSVAVSQSRLVVGACVGVAVSQSRLARAWVGDGAVLMINAGTCWCLWQRLPIPTEHIYIAQLPRARTQHLMTLYGT